MGCERNGQTVNQRITSALQSGLQGGYKFIKNLRGSENLAGFCLFRVRFLASSRILYLITSTPPM